MPYTKKSSVSKEENSKEEKVFSVSDIVGKPEPNLTVPRPPEPASPTPYFNQINNTPTESVAGILDIQSEGHGFLRPKFIPSQKDIYISQSQIRRFSL